MASVLLTYKLYTRIFSTMSAEDVLVNYVSSRNSIQGEADKNAL